MIINYNLLEFDWFSDAEISYDWGLVFVIERQLIWIKSKTLSNVQHFHATRTPIAQIYLVHLNVDAMKVSKAADSQVKQKLNH